MNEGIHQVVDYIRHTNASQYLGSEDGVIKRGYLITETQSSF